MKVDLQQLVKNRKTRPEQYVRQPNIYLLISFEGRMTSIQLYTWKDSIISGNLHNWTE